ncbi:hypothetical protein [Escherichia coli]|uniref:hypothetical protein n=1 Tax=Escherichia coli TaxID=562 RepID=UPI00065136FE|nr:hypothetical protein [Escherichia coli]
MTQQKHTIKQKQKKNNQKQNGGPTPNPQNPKTAEHATEIKKNSNEQNTRKAHDKQINIRQELSQSAPKLRNQSRKEQTEERLRKKEKKTNKT